MFRHRVFLSALFLSIGLTACQTTLPKEKISELKRFEFSQPEMGVPFRIVLYAPTEKAGTEAATAAFNRIAELNQKLSDYETDSELNRLSRTSGHEAPTAVSDDLWRVLVRAQEIAELSDGAFDITVGPAVVLWRKARRVKELPSPESLTNALKAVGYKKLLLDPAFQSAQLLAPHMKLDLGGIAKGFAADEALRTLRGLGIRRALVAASGDIAVSEPPPGKKGWRIEVAPLDTTNSPPKRFILLSHAAVSTSGDMFQRLEIGGKRYSHIVDPATGIGLIDHSLVTTIARNGMTADALSKVVAIRGHERGFEIIRKIPGTAAFVVRQPEDKIETFQTPDFEKFLIKNEKPAQ
jgi:thiamine biosynthesis lipoprotein